MSSLLNKMQTKDGNDRGEITFVPTGNSASTLPVVGCRVESISPTNIVNTKETGGKLILVGTPNPGGGQNFGQVRLVSGGLSGNASLMQAVPPTGTSLIMVQGPNVQPVQRGAYLFNSVQGEHTDLFFRYNDGTLVEFPFDGTQGITKLYFGYPDRGQLVPISNALKNHTNVARDQWQYAKETASLSATVAQQKGTGFISVQNGRPDGTIELAGPNLVGGEITTLENLIASNGGRLQVVSMIPSELYEADYAITRFVPGGANSTGFPSAAALVEGKQGNHYGTTSVAQTVFCETASCDGPQNRNPRGLTLNITAIQGRITAIAIVNPGSGYKTGDVVKVVGGNNEARVQIFQVVSDGRLPDSLQIERRAGTGAADLVGVTAISHVGPSAQTDLAADQIVAGSIFVITDSGTTDFVSIGSQNNNVGTAFRATRTGSGTGTVRTTFGNNNGIVALTNFAKASAVDAASKRRQYDRALMEYETVLSLLSHSRITTFTTIKNRFPGLETVYVTRLDRRGEDTVVTLETGSGNPVNMIGANNLNWSAQVGAAERNNGTFLFGLGSGQASSAARGGPQILSGILSAAAQSVPALATWNEDYDEDLKYTVGNPLLRLTGTATLAANGTLTATGTTTFTADMVGGLVTFPGVPQNFFIRQFDTATQMLVSPPGITIAVAAAITINYLDPLYVSNAVSSTGVSDTQCGSIALPLADVNFNLTQGILSPIGFQIMQSDAGRLITNITQLTPVPIDGSAEYDSDGILIGGFRLEQRSIPSWEEGMYVSVAVRTTAGPPFDAWAAYEIRNPRTGAVVNFDNDIDFSLQPQMHLQRLGAFTSTTLSTKQISMMSLNSSLSIDVATGPIRRVGNTWYLFPHANIYSNYHYYDFGPNTAENSNRLHHCIFGANTDYMEQKSKVMTFVALQKEGYTINRRAPDQAALTGAVSLVGSVRGVTHIAIGNSSGKSRTQTGEAPLAAGPASVDMLPLTAALTQPTVAVASAADGGSITTPTPAASIGSFVTFAEFPNVGQAIDDFCYIIGRRGLLDKRDFPSVMYGGSSLPGTSAAAPAAVLPTQVFPPAGGTGAGVATTCIIGTPGTGYGAAVGVAGSGGHGQGIEFQILAVDGGGGITLIRIQNGGSGYQVGDIILVGGAGTGGTVVVTSVSNSETPRDNVTGSTQNAVEVLCTWTPPVAPATAGSIIFQRMNSNTRAS